MTEDTSEISDRLKSAIPRGDAAEVRELLAAAPGLPAVLPPGQQAEWLISAIKAPAAQAELLELLLHAGLNPGSVDTRLSEDYWSTPFITAAKLGCLDLMEMLADAGADIHWCSPTGANAASETFPSRACQAPCPDTAEMQAVRAWLAERGVRMDPLCADSRRKLYWAAHSPGSWPDIPVLLELGMDASILRWTPFLLQLACGEVTLPEVVTAMPEEEIAHRDSFNRTPFLMAVAARRMDFAAALVGRGADLHTRGWYGATALHLAADNDDAEAIIWLAGQGLPADIPDDQQHMPLHNAVSHNAVRATRTLLALGADVNAADKNCYRAIHRTTSREMLELLLQAGADVNDISGGGDWPLKDACQAGDAELVKFLLSQGARPDLTATGETAFFSAVRADSLECVKLLLEAGAKINARDVDGETCFDGVNSVPMAEMLLAHGGRPQPRRVFSRAPEDWPWVPRPVAARFAQWRKERGGK